MNKRGQIILDYVVLLLIVIAVLLIMGYYIRNSIAGKIRDGANVFGQGETYRPWKSSEPQNTITNQ